MVKKEWRTDRQTDGRTDGQTDGLNQSYSCLVAAKNVWYLFRRESVIFSRFDKQWELLSANEHRNDIWNHFFIQIYSSTSSKNITRNIHSMFAHLFIIYSLVCLVFASSYQPYFTWISSTNHNVTMKDLLTRRAESVFPYLSRGLVEIM